MLVGVIDDALVMQLFNELGHDVVDLNVMTNYKRSMETIEQGMLDLVVFTGGADVTPSFYGEPAHPATHSQLVRDNAEKRAFNKCAARDIPMAGICRGAQFLTVMNGGKLVQHVNGHGLGGVHTHGATCFDSSATAVMNKQDTFHVQCTSTHHQVMYPFNLDDSEFELLAWARQNPSVVEGMPCSLEYKDVDRFYETEAVWFPKNKCLCTQFHPEYVGNEHECFKYYEWLINRYIVGIKDQWMMEIFK